MYKFLKNADDEKRCICTSVYKTILLEEADILTKTIRSIRMISYFNFDMYISKRFF